MNITLKGNTVHTSGNLPSVGSKAPDFTLVKTDLSSVSLKDFAGKTLLLNIFISLDTSACATSVVKFNQEAAKHPNCEILCISMDLPFAQERFCGAKDLKNVIPLSAFRSPDFGKNYGLSIVDGPLASLLARAIVIINPEGNITYTELVPEITHEPNYEAALQKI